MADTVGAIALQLQINRKEFERDLKKIARDAVSAGDEVKRGTSKIEDSMKSLRKTIVAAFSIKTIVDFGKSCLELGSDLSEVQNVVDVSFKTMSAQIDEFAKNAITQFGMSETLAKKYCGTIGAMANAFGFAEKASADMAMKITGLTGDVASFYNLDHDTAFTKLKGIFTGESEGLKDLGVVMTQNALDQYALANGFGKTTAQMTEQEKVSLRYKFVLEQLSSASGDFARTSGGWANQTRVLTLQFESLKASLGQGFINLFTPILVQINKLISRLNILAQKFRDFTALLMGKQSDSGGGGPGTNALSSTEASTDAIGNAAEEAGKKAEEAKKKIHGLMSFDVINKLQSDESSSDSSGAGSGSSAAGAVESAVLKDANSQASKLNNRLKEIKNLISKGFWDGFGGKAVFGDVQKNLKSIRKDLAEIFTDPKVQNASKKWAESLIYNLAKIGGSVASVGATIADALTGGIAKYLSKNKDRLKGYIIQLFDAGAEINDLVGDFAAAFAEIFSVFRSDSAKQIISDLIQIFTDAFANGLVLAGKFGRDLIGFITAPIVENKDAIKPAIESLFGSLSEITGTLAGSWQQCCDELQKMYDERLHPLFVSLRDGISDSFGKILDIYNEKFAPMIDDLAQKFSKMWKSHIQPILSSIIDLVGSLAGLIQAFWEETLKPAVDWAIENILPLLEPILDIVGTALIEALGLLADIIKVVADAVKSLSDFLQEHKVLLDGLCTFVAALVAQLGLLKGALAIKNFAAGFLELSSGTSGLFKIVSSLGGAIGKVAMSATKILGPALAFITSPAGIAVAAIAAIVTVGVLLYKNWDKIKAAASSLWKKIKEVFGAIKDFMQEKFLPAWNKIIGKIKDIVHVVVTKISEYIGKIRDTFTKIKDFVAKTFLPIWNSIVGKIKDPIKNAFELIVRIAKTYANTISSIINGILRGICGGINGITGMLNNLKISIPDWVPGIGGSSLSFNLPKLTAPQIPMLAEGGFVKANTPRLAVIGDNKRYGEIVAPENKLAAMARMAATEANGGNDDRVIELLTQILKAILDMDLNLYIDDVKLTNKIIKCINRKTRSTGKSPLVAGAKS